MHHKAMLVPRMVMKKFANQVAAGVRKAADKPRETTYIRPDSPDLDS